MPSMYRDRRIFVGSSRRLNRGALSRVCRPGLPRPAEGDVAPVFAGQGRLDRTNGPRVLNVKSAADSPK